MGRMRGWGEGQGTDNHWTDNQAANYAAYQKMAF